MKNVSLVILCIYLLSNYQLVNGNNQQENEPNGRYFKFYNLDLILILQDIDPCTLPMVVGPCEAIISRYYYNQDTNECVEFDYGGCEGYYI
jgi:hypothetical protein